MNNVIKPNLPIITGRPSAPPKAPDIKGHPQGGQSFREMFAASMPKTQTHELTFSKHAQARIAQRGVEISAENMQQLGAAIDLADSKGITDSLVYLDGTAFIVNIPGKVVVTVVDNGDTAQNVFTNINGAVIL